MHGFMEKEENYFPYNAVEVLLRHAAILPSSVATYLTLIRSLLRRHRHDHASIRITIGGRSRG